MKYVKLMSGILLFILLGCNFYINPGKNNEPKNIACDLSGIAVYIGPLDSVRFGAKGTRVGAYQNDQEIAYSTITSENGAFQLQGLKTGLYDLVFTTDQMYQQAYHYHPGKIADFTIYSGENSLPYTVQMRAIDPEELDSIIVVQFKRQVTIEESLYIIDQSGCSISYPIPSLGFYCLRMPSMESEHKMVEWFSKRTKVLWASVYLIMPLDSPKK
jgi:hypothetical protein